MLKIACRLGAVLVLACLHLTPGMAAGPVLSHVQGFGSNPGKLRMFKYVPVGLPANAPLVVALHGCSQTASVYDDETGWVKFADKFRFALLLPEQMKSNHVLLCFNWFEPGDFRRDQGEALSIRQMIERMKADHGIDPKRIFVTGLSAGGGMTSVMLAAYPDVFAGGAILGGTPYHCAENMFVALPCMNPGSDRTPEQWGALVRNATGHAGPWPIVSIWQGMKDKVVAPMNAAELVDQWTNVHGADHVADVQDEVSGHPHRVFNDPSGRPVVETYLIADMAHGTPIAPGPGPEQCGTVAPFILNAGICSSYYIAKFWGLVPPTASAAR